jgi:hypothetical protein
MARGDGHGLTPLEQDVLDLWDGGASIEKIMRARALDRNHVNKIVGQYAHSVIWRGSDAFDAMVKAGSQALLRAIERTGRRYS